jgi:ribonuclease HII
LTFAKSDFPTGSLRKMSATASTTTPVHYKLRYKDDDLIEVGLDEAGRGCLFGRLYVGAVVFTNDMDDMFDQGAMLKTIKDSKLLTKRRRDILYDYTRECALAYSVAYAEVPEIDTFNILQADLSAMHRALDSLQVPVQRVLADGDHWRPYGDTEGYAIVDGDAQYLPIAAAGILAKVSRDRWVESVVATHPEWDTKYGLSRNMGYGTADHMKGIEEHGVTSEHRRSFRPVAAALGLPTRSGGSSSNKGRRGVVGGSGIGHKKWEGTCDDEAIAGTI